MDLSNGRLPCYLVEWYGPGRRTESIGAIAVRLTECAASISAARAPVQLLMALDIPDDEYVFGVFAAESPDVVAEACARAGMPAERISAAIDAGIAPAINEGTSPPICRGNPDSTATVAE